MNTDLYQQTIGAIISTLQILIPLGGAFYAFYKGKGVEFVETKINTIQDTKTKDLVQCAFDRVDELLTDGITSAENTVKQDLIKQISEGKVSKDSLKQIGVDVVSNVISQLNDKTINALKEEISDVESYVNNRLETKLANLKLDTTSSVSKTTVQEPTQPVVDTTELENQLVQANNDKDSLSQQINQLQKTQNDLQNTNNQLNQTISSVQSENESLKAQLSNIQNALSGVTNSVSNASVQPVVDNIQGGTLINVEATIPTQTVVQ